MVMRFPVVVERTSNMTCAGQGKYSYCHPVRGLRPSWLAVMAVEKMNCGISDHHRPEPALQLPRLLRSPGVSPSCSPPDSFPPHPPPRSSTSSCPPFRQPP